LHFCQVVFNPPLRSVAPPPSVETHLWR